MVCTSVLGHLMGCDFPASSRKWSACEPVECFSLPVEKFVPEVCLYPLLTPSPYSLHPPQGMKNVETVLKREARQCNELICWLDCDREGENIAYEVIDVSKTTFPLPPSRTISLPPIGL